MAEIRVRNLPDWLVEWYKDSAEQQGKPWKATCAKCFRVRPVQKQAAFAARLQEGLDQLAEKIRCHVRYSTVDSRDADERG